MAMVEIESEDFIKALRLLHSRAHESTDELGKLLDLYYAKQQNMVTVHFILTQFNLTTIFCL